MVLVLTLLLALVPAGQQPASKIQVILVGHIRKIDAKTRTITVRERVYPDGGKRAPVALPGAERGRRRRGPLDDPLEMPKRGSGIETDTKVIYSADTAIKSADKP